MSKSWPRMKLADCVELLSGYAFKSQYFTNKPDDIALVKGENVSQGHVLWEISKRWPAVAWNELEKFKLRVGDVVIAMDRPWVPAGLKWCFIRQGDPKSFLVQRCCRLRSNPMLVDQSFLRFVIGGPSFEGYIKPITTGVNVPHISGGQILNFEIEIPPLPVQRRIAGILSAYDELIENSQRRIRLLEDMARALYREWFIHFRFPRDPSEVLAKEAGNEPAPRPAPKRSGSADTPLVPSPLGNIPQGWEVKTLDKVTTKVGSGATPRGGKGAYHAEGINLIRSLNIYDYQFEFDDLAFINDEQAAQLDNVTVQAHDVLLNITGASVCRCAMVPSYLLPARVNQHVAIIRADARCMDPHYLLDTINNDYNKQKLLGLAQGGATREALTKETICNFPILVPPRELLTRYGQVAGVIHAQRETLQRRNQNLRSTRDLLLPRLLSGQVALASVPA